MATLIDNVNQAISDFDSIKTAIIDKGVDVPTDTPTSQYASKISSITSGGKGIIFEQVDSNGYPLIVDATYLTDEIKPYSFFTNSNGLYSLTTDIKLNSNVTNIGSYAFQNCSSLALTSLPSGITNIGNYTFNNCRSLVLTSLPSGITNIGSYAFYTCSSLASIKFLGIPNTILSTVFIDCTNLIDIYVPWSEGAVANAPWGAKNATIHYNWSDDNAS